MLRKVKPYSLARSLALFIRDKRRAAGGGLSALQQAINHLAMIVNPAEWSIDDCVEFASIAGFPTHRDRCWSVAMFRDAARDIIRRAATV